MSDCLVAAVAFGSIVLSGCRSGDWDGTSSSTTLRVDKITSVSVVDGTNGSARAVTTIEYERPTDPELAAFVDGFISKGYMKATHFDILDRSDKDGLRAMLLERPGMDTVREAFEKEYADIGTAEDWELKGSGTFMWFNDMFATYRTTIFTYFGGMHPNVWHGNATYDRRTGRRITIADMFDETNIVSVINVIRRTIAADESCSGYLREKCSNDVAGVAADFLGECDFGNPKVTDNFMLVEKGIVWTYNEYEISSYSEGSTDVFVPWEEIGPYLREFAPTPITVPIGGWEAALEAAKKNGDFDRVGDLIFFTK